ncbi:MAG: MotA/TolQ/ExbB proton channel family protein [Wenzhouxiangellaceae bacterium]
MKRTSQLRSAHTFSLFLLILAILAPALQAQDDAADASAQTADAGTEATAEQAAVEPIPEPEPQRALDQLQQAYEKEYAFLIAQRAELQERLQAFRARATQEGNQAETDIDRLQGAIAGLQSRGDRLNNLLTEADRNIATIEENRSTLEATYQQAGSTLEQQNIELDKAAFASLPDEDKITTLFDAAGRMLSDAGSVYRTDGKFYLLDGTEVSGSILKLGNIAAYGVSGEHAGVLAPAGEGRYKLWREPATEAAKALVGGQRPDNLPIFLYESLNKPIEESEDRGILGTIQDGGTIAWVIVALGLIALLMVILRSIFLQRAGSSTDKVLAETRADLEQGKRDQALHTCQQYGGATGRVMAATIRNLDRDREHVEDIVSEAILHESAHLNRFGSIIMVIAAVAPLLGLLGTVTGMITTFDIITEFGTGDPKLLSGGISIALITTEIGLIVAIPALIFGNLLSGWAESIKDNMEKAALRVINLEQSRRPSN